LVTDLRVYDWWDLASAWDEGHAISKPGAEALHGKQAQWAQELMIENRIMSLPRTLEQMTR
jgi:hypothetical protein